MTDLPFDRVVVIFNPESTGEAPRLAHELRDELGRRVPDLPVELTPTERAGHARELAGDAAAGPGRPLIVSVSGDGGYNEVVDGVAKAGANGAGGAVCAVLGAGNANDHQRVTADRPLVDAVVDGRLRRLDLLRVTIGAGAAGADQVRHAHSYVGLGITPVVALDLEQGGKGSLREIVSVIRSFARYRPFEIRLDDGTQHRFDSLVLANISEMAKYARLSDDGRPDDGRFEVVTIAHASRLRVLGQAVRAAIKGLGPQPTATRYAFTTIKPMPVQLDGELLELDAGTEVVVECAAGALTTLDRTPPEA